MLGFLPSLGIKHYAAIAGVVVVLALALHYRATLRENARLEAAIESANATVRKLDAKAENEAALAASETTLLEAINHAETTEDAPPALVVIDTMRRIDRMRHARTGEK